MAAIYFDNAATTFRKPESVYRAVQTAMKTCSSPGRGGYKQAENASGAVFELRERAQQLFNLDEPQNAVLTMNATHALNIAIKSLVSEGDRVLTSGYEHNSVMRPLRALGADVKILRTELFDTEEALAEFAGQIKTEKPKAVIINHVSNVFGFVMPVERIAEVCRKYFVPFIIDASQSAGILDVDMSMFGADFIAMPGHKGLYGPQGTGLLLCSREGRSLLEGGTGSDSASDEMPHFLPDRHEAGTHNVPGAAGLAAGIAFVQAKGLRNIRAYEQSLLEHAAKELSALDEVIVYKSQNHEAQSSVLSFSVKNADCEDAARLLAHHGVALRAGLHCAPEAHKTAGTFPNGTLRASFSVFNTHSQIDTFIKILKMAIKSLKKSI